MYLKKLFRVVIILLLFNYIYNSVSDNKLVTEKVDNIILNKEKVNVDYLYISKFNYKGLIKMGEYNDILDSNYILRINNNSNITSNYFNIVLAGHNNKYVFSCIYRLEIGDKIELHLDNVIYEFYVSNIKKVNINDTYILDNSNNQRILTLITCTNDNQRRYVVKCSLT